MPKYYDFRTKDGAEYLRQKEKEYNPGVSDEYAGALVTQFLMNSDKLREVSKEHLEIVEDFAKNNFEREAFVMNDIQFKIKYLFNRGSLLVYPEQRANYSQQLKDIFTTMVEKETQLPRQPEPVMPKPSFLGQVKAFFGWKND